MCSNGDGISMMTMMMIAIAIVMATAVMTVTGVGLEAPTPTQLLLEYQPSPVIGVDVAAPRVSWALSGNHNGSSLGIQTVGYHISIFKDGAVACHSGRVNVPEGSMWINGSINLGDFCTFTSDTETVQVWVNYDSKPVGDPSATSLPAIFRTGLIEELYWENASSIAASQKPSATLGRYDLNNHIEHCLENCSMVPVKGGYHTGSYNESQAHNINSIAECQTACLNDPACVQITWAPSHHDKCVLYQAIYTRISAGALGWVKCVNGSTSDTCAAVSPGPTPPPPAKSPANYLQTSFDAPKDVSVATLYISAVGWADPYINGRLVAPSDALNPGRSTFDKRQLYLAYNVTAMINVNSKNILGIVLAAGWQSMGHHQLSTKALLKLQSSFGHKYFVKTDTNSWVGSTAGPIVSANIYAGEVYDSRLEMPDWCTVPQTQWQSTIEVTEFSSILPTWQPMQPIRKLEINHAISMTPITIPARHMNKQLDKLQISIGVDAEMVYVFKFAQNAAGTAVLSVTDCPNGTALQMYYSENICGYGPTRWSPPCTAGQPPGSGVYGTVDQRNLHGNWYTEYICDGRKNATWEARFTYTGFQFVELHGHNFSLPNLNTISQHVVHSDVEGAPIPEDDQNVPRVLSGSIAFGDTTASEAPKIDGKMCYQGEGCSADRPPESNTAVLDQLSHNVRWTLIDNLHSVPEDCDQRNERWGWMADASVSAEADYYYHWMPSLYSHWLQSMRDVQTDPSAYCEPVTGPQGDTNVVNGTADCSGAVGDRTPGATPTGLPGDPSWMFAYPLVYSYQHRYFADTRLANSLWAGIQEFSDFLMKMASRGRTGLVSWAKYGDWLQPGKVASNNLIGQMSSSFSYGETIRIAMKTAAAIGDKIAFKKYSDAFTTIQNAFHKTYYVPASKTYGDGTQAAITYALYLEAVPANLKDEVFEQLIKLIYTGTNECDSTPCVATGILTTKWMMELLSVNGRTDVGLDLAFKTDFPSWGYMAAMNSTTVWEHWEYMNGPGMNSHNHPALASVGAWFFRWVAGLRLDESDGTYAQGWRSIRFAPGCVTDERLPAVQVRVSTPLGPIKASWKNVSGNLFMELSLPPDVTGTVVVPAVVGGGAAAMTVRTVGATLWEAGSVKDSTYEVVSTAKGEVNIYVGSGMHRFIAHE